MKKDAGFSACRTWRYWLSRTWDESGTTLAVIGLNPSTADENADDPTIRRCMGFARSWGHGGLMMFNLFAYRATDPEALHEASDAIGLENDSAIRGLTYSGQSVLCAWGAHPKALGRDLCVSRMLEGRKLICLGETKGGYPRHPLYVKASTSPVPFDLWKRLAP